MVLRKQLFALLFAVALHSCTSVELDNPCDRRNNSTPSQECYLQSVGGGSSSSVGGSSSSSVGSSSSSSEEPSDLCTGFVNGTIREDHYGMDKPQFCDQRDGKKYVYVNIGEQTWMAENLNYNTPGSKCYAEGVAGVSADSIATNCATYGRLYIGNTALGAESSNAVPSGVRGICPAGWHLPSEMEWGALLEKADGAALKSATGWYHNTGQDTYGFSALPGGHCSSGTGDCANYITHGYWWTSTTFFSQYDENAAYMISMNYIDNVEKSGTLLPGRNMPHDGSLFSVRCVQD